MSNHTTGLWTFVDNKIKGNSYNVASVNSNKTTEGKANGLLLAAAPELLFALQDCIDALRIHAPDAWALEQANKALNKAKGLA